VTIKDISRATGLNPALIYYYFGNKEGLFRKVVESTTRDAIKTFEGIRDEQASPREIVSTWIENHILQFDLMQKLIKISLDYANTRNRTPQIDREIRRFYDIEAKILGSAIREGIAQGVFVPVNVARISSFTSTFLDGVLVRSAMMRELDVRSTISDLKNLVLLQLEAPDQRNSRRSSRKAAFG
jgi:AcrR family transcriptional regulator